MSLVADFTASPIKTMRVQKLNKPFEVMEIRGVKVFARWSVILIGAVILLGALEEPLLAVAVLSACYGVILIHECGHMIAARPKGYRVWSIELYPVWGITRFSEPGCYFDRCVIAWGGVVAQAIVAVTLLIWAETSGCTRFQAVNANLPSWASLVGVSQYSIYFRSVLSAEHSLGPAPRIPQTLHAKPARRKPGWASWR